MSDSDNTTTNTAVERARTPQVTQSRPQTEVEITYCPVDGTPIEHWAGKRGPRREFCSTTCIQYRLRELARRDELLEEVEKLRLDAQILIDRMTTASERNEGIGAAHLRRGRELLGELTRHVAHVQQVQRSGSVSRINDEAREQTNAAAGAVAEARRLYDHIDHLCEQVGELVGQAHAQAAAQALARAQSEPTMLVSAPPAVSAPTHVVSVATPLPSAAYEQASAIATAPVAAPVSPSPAAGLLPAWVEEGLRAVLVHVPDMMRPMYQIALIGRERSKLLTFRKLLATEIIADKEAALRALVSAAPPALRERTLSYLDRGAPADIVLDNLALQLGLPIEG